MAVKAAKRAGVATTGASAREDYTRRLLSDVPKLEDALIETSTPPPRAQELP